jgi:lipid II:glycine glycyltransferase (peptidoglycan interpeptide bridge formation enzyme)
MGFNWNLTKEELEEIDRKRSLLKVPIAYKVDDSLEVPDLSDNFTPKEEKAIKRIKTEVVDIKIKKTKTKNKSNKLYE